MQKFHVFMLTRDWTKVYDYSEERTAVLLMVPLREVGVELTDAPGINDLRAWPIYTPEWMRLSAKEGEDVHHALYARALTEFVEKLYVWEHWHSGHPHRDIEPPEYTQEKTT